MSAGTRRRRAARPWLAGSAVAAVGAAAVSYIAWSLAMMLWGGWPW